jgi:predicted ATPase
MRIVVSGTHASGKSTLISDFALRHPGFTVLPDPFDLMDETWDTPNAALFAAQLRVAATRLSSAESAGDVIAERGPIDFLAYLAALADLGRPSVGRDDLARLRATTAEAMAHVDLLVVLTLEVPDVIRVPDDEDPGLRTAMDAHLLDLCDDDELIGAVGRVVEVGGSPQQRLDLVLVAGPGARSSGRDA